VAGKPTVIQGYIKQQIINSAGATDPRASSGRQTSVGGGKGGGGGWGSISCQISYHKSKQRIVDHKRWTGLLLTINKDRGTHVLIDIIILIVKQNSGTSNRTVYNRDVRRDVSRDVRRDVRREVRRDVRREKRKGKKKRENNKTITGTIIV